MRDEDVNLYNYERLKREFGPFLHEAKDGIPSRTERELVGEPYRRMLAEMTKVVSHQWGEHIDRSALKGFLFHGAVGVGKTAMAKRLTYELCRIFGDSDAKETRENEVVLIIVDAADISRGRYGDSEEQLKRLFEYARNGDVHGHQHEEDSERRTVLLFDDVESLFLKRSSGSAKEWHFSQNSVFFHNIDELDTARTVVVLTTNLIYLLDEAIIDRFLRYEFGAPQPEVLEEVAREKARLQHLSDGDLKPVLEELRKAGQVKSIREVERLIMRAYVAKALTHR